MSFKELIQNDFSILFNPEEFGEPHQVDNRELMIVIDNDQLKERSQKEYNGIAVGEILFFVNLKDFGEQPEPGAPLVFDGRLMYVFNCKEDMGMYEIILTQNRSG